MVGGKSDSLRMRIQDGKTGISPNCEIFYPHCPLGSPPQKAPFPTAGQSFSFVKIRLPNAFLGSDIGTPPSR